MSLVPSWNVVEQFERRVAEYVGAPHAVAVDTCTAGLFLCLRWWDGLPGVLRPVVLPKRTYLGVALASVHAGYKIKFHQGGWIGWYRLTEGVVDSACHFTENCFAGGMECYSFQYRKHLKIGRGGMVCTDDKDAADWLRKARFLGRSEHNGVPEFVGWHAFMEPERAARGLVLMDSLPRYNDDLVFEYPDLSTYDCLKEHLV